MYIYTYTSLSIIPVPSSVVTLTSQKTSGCPVVITISVVMLIMPVAMVTTSPVVIAISVILMPILVVPTLPLMSVIVPENKIC